MEALREALAQNNDDAVEDALDALKAQGPTPLVHGLRAVLEAKRARGVAEHELTGLRYRLGAALETAAEDVGAAPADAAALALEAATIARDVLNDGEGATRALTLALRLAADDDAALKRTVEAAGGHEPALTMLEKAAKRCGKDRDLDAVTGRLRHALARIYELVLCDKERAFFEALKAARKVPTEGMYVDDVYRLALDVKRLDEAAAFFQSLADDGVIPARARASALNKLGALFEARGDRTQAFAAYVGSLHHHETKAARKKAERLKLELSVSTPLPPPIEAAPAPAREAAAVPAAPDTPPASPEPAPETDVAPEIVEEARVDPAADTVVAPRPELSIPPPPPDDDDDDLERAIADFERGVFTDEAKAIPCDVSAEDAVISEERVDPALRSAAEEDDARRRQPPPAPADDEPSLVVMRDERIDATVERPAEAPTQTLPPAEPTALPAEPAPPTPSEPGTAATAEPPPGPATPASSEPTKRAVASTERIERSDQLDAPLPPPAPPVDGSYAARASAADDLSETSDRKKAKRKKNKKDKRRGHGSQTPEATTPGPSLPAVSETSQPPGAPLEHASAAVAPRHAPPADDASLPVLRPALSLDDALPEPALTAPPAEPASEDEAVHPPPPVPPEIVPAAPPAALVPAGPEEAPRPTREELIARAQSLLDDGDAEECLACADELAAVLPGDPRVLRLAGRALLLRAPSGALPPAGVELMLRDARRHGERAAALLREIQLALPAEHRRDYDELWLAGARAAGHDVDRVHALLEESAAHDAPDGPMFATLDAALADHGDVDRRDALHLRAWRALGEDPRFDDETRDARRADVLRRRIELLEGARRDPAAVQAWAQLALEHKVDAATRSAARRAHEKKAPPDERARFLARLARRADAQHASGDEVASILRELLELRVAVDDKVGAEATARDLLGRVPGDARAIGVLADLLAGDPRRAAELVDVLRARADAALAANDKDGARQALERLARALTSLQRHDDAAAALAEAARTAPGDAALVERVLEGLLGAGRVNDAVDLLEELAGRALARDAARLLLRGAALARERLGKRGRARELIEKAVAAQPKDLRVLEAHADLLLEVGDATAALAALERIAAEETDTKARARVHLRIGHLLEEHLHRPDDAIKRYRAAVDVDKTLREAWDALLALCRTRGDKAGVVDALTGLAQLQTGPARAAILVRLGRVHEKERNDPVAAAAAYEAALAADAGNIDALTGLLSVRALALQGERDVEAALAVPAPELVDELYRPLLNAESVGAALPFSFRRLLALAVTQAGDNEGARRRFEALLEERPDDLPTLLAFARHLAAAARLPSSPTAIAAADARRREVLEAVLLHHAYALKPVVHVDVWGEVCSLRLQQGDVAGAKKAAKKALALIAAAERPGDLEDALSDRAVSALVLSLEDIIPTSPDVAGVVDDTDIDLLEQALALDLQRAIAPSEKAKLKEKQARVALYLRKDTAAARALLDEALRLDPDASTARELLFDLELQGEDPREVLEQSRALVATERDPRKKAALHLRLFRLQKRLRFTDDVAAAEIKAAVELDPKNPQILDAAEKFFADSKDGKELDALYTTRLKALDRGDVPARLALLERLAQLRRYDLRDLRSAIDACEAMSALDPDAIKPREDAARMYVELGQWKEAVAAWRAVLDRDTLLVEAWRGLFSVFARSRQADEAFTVAATMVALEIADDDMVRAVKSVRPPFPRWPIPPADVSAARKKLAHPLERTAVRAVLEIVAPRLLPRLGRPLADFGMRRKDALAEKNLPPSVAMAVRTATALSSVAGTKECPGSIPLYGAELGSSDGSTPPFAALPAREPGLIVTQEVLRGGMTPERAFALGRAVAWLSPWALLAAALDAAEIRRLLEGLVAAYLTARDVEKPSVELERYGAEVRAELEHGLPPTERDAFAASLSPALRDWVVARARLRLSDWKAGVGYGGDRLGFLLCSDLPAAVKVIRSAGGSTMAARLAIKELVLFSISPAYLQLRRELSLALPEQALAPILDLG